MPKLLPTVEDTVEFILGATIFGVACTPRIFYAILFATRISGCYWQGIPVTPLIILAILGILCYNPGLFFAVLIGMKIYYTIRWILAIVTFLLVVMVELVCRSPPVLLWTCLGMFLLVLSLAIEGLFHGSYFVYPVVSWVGERATKVLEAVVAVSTAAFRNRANW